MLSNIHQKISGIISNKKTFGTAVSLATLLVIFNLAAADIYNKNADPKSQESFSAMGIVTEVSSSTLSLSIDGSVRTFNPTTVEKIESKSYVQLSIADIKSGDTVIVQGVNEDGVSILKRIINMTWNGQVLAQDDATTTMATTTVTTSTTSTTDIDTASTTQATTTETISSGSGLGSIDIGTTTIDIASSSAETASTTESTTASTTDIDTASTTQATTTETISSGSGLGSIDIGTTTIDIASSTDSSSQTPVEPTEQAAMTTSVIEPIVPGNSDTVSSSSPGENQ